MQRAQHRGGGGQDNYEKWNRKYDDWSYNNAGPDAMTWASTWEMMNRTLEAFATRNTDSSEREEVANPGKPSKSQKNLRMTQTDASILG